MAPARFARQGRTSRAKTPGRNFFCGLFRPIPAQGGSRWSKVAQETDRKAAHGGPGGARPQSGKRAAEARAPRSPQPADFRSRTSCRDPGTRTARRAPHHGPESLPATNEESIMRGRAAQRPGARDRAPRREARKPSEWNERPAIEGKERVSTRCLRESSRLGEGQGGGDRLPSRSHADTPLRTLGAWSFATPRASRKNEHKTPTSFTKSEARAHKECRQQSLEPVSSLSVFLWARDRHADNVDVRRIDDLGNLSHNILRPRGT